MKKFITIERVIESLILGGVVAACFMMKYLHQFIFIFGACALAEGVAKGATHYYKRLPYLYRLGASVKHARKPRVKWAAQILYGYYFECVEKGLIKNQSTPPIHSPHDPTPVEHGGAPNAR